MSFIKDKKLFQASILGLFSVIALFKALVMLKTEGFNTKMMFVGLVGISFAALATVIADKSKDNPFKIKSKKDIPLIAIPLGMIAGAGTAFILGLKLIGFTISVLFSALFFFFVYYLIYREKI